MKAFTFARRQRGQSLVDYLLSNHTGKIGPELDRENAHFSVSEAMIAAIEEVNHLKIVLLLFKTYSSLCLLLQ